MLSQKGRFPSDCLPYPGVAQIRNPVLDRSQTLPPQPIPSSLHALACRLGRDALSGRRHRDSNPLISTIVTCYAKGHVDTSPEIFQLSSFGELHIHLERGDEGLLRDVDLAELAHALLALPLLVQELALARGVAAV